MTTFRQVASRALALWLSSATIAAAQACPDGVSPAGHLGIRWLHCANNGPCFVSDNPRDRWYDLANEPIAREVDPAGPAAGVIRDGDVIVSVNGALTTSLEGGRALGTLVPGRPAALVLRRGTALRAATVVPRASCRAMGLAVVPARDSAEFANRMTSPMRVPRPSPGAAVVTRQRTPRLDLEMSGPLPVVSVDSTTGIVTLRLGATTVRITPRTP